VWTYCANDLAGDPVISFGLDDRPSSSGFLQPPFADMVAVRSQLATRGLLSSNLGSEYFWVCIR
jgi:hypothetical protein